MTRALVDDLLVNTREVHEADGTRAVGDVPFCGRTVHVRRDAANIESEGFCLQRRDEAILGSDFLRVFQNYRAAIAVLLVRNGNRGRKERIPDHLLQRRSLGRAVLRLALSKNELVG